MTVSALIETIATNPTDTLAWDVLDDAFNDDDEPAWASSVKLLREHGIRPARFELFPISDNHIELSGWAAYPLASGVSPSMYAGHGFCWAEFWPCSYTPWALSRSLFDSLRSYSPTWSRKGYTKVFETEKRAWTHLIRAARGIIM